MSSDKPSEYERKLIDMQYHMRENNAYLDDYMKDLNAWTDDIKKKEENLKNSSDISSTTSKELPPVRNFVPPPKPKKKSNKKTTTKKPSAIRSSDYRAWDKFDVDAECERIDNDGDNEEEDEDGDDGDDDDDEWLEEVSKKKAEHFKDLGNYQFKQKSYAEAIENYTKAIECDPKCPIYFANRAQCQIFEERYGACEADCTLAIQLDKNFLKAYYRRAMARIQLGKTELAKEDLEYILSRDPENKDAKNKLDGLIRTDEIKRLGRVYPLTSKPVEERSKKPLKRIDIQEIDTSIVPTSTTIKKKNIVIEEIDTIPESSEQLPVQTSAPSPPAAAPPSKPVSSPAPPPPPPTSQTQKAPSKSVSVPTTGYQFKRDWSSLNNQLDQQSAYFERIPPKSYKTIFSTGLDSSVFSRILLLWSNKATIDDQLIDSMYELRQTSRFDTQLSFLDNNDKKLLKNLLEKLETHSSTEKVQTVLKTYKLD